MNTGRALGGNRRGKVGGMGLLEARGLSVCFYLRPLLGSRTDHSRVRCNPSRSSLPRHMWARWIYTKSDKRGRAPWMYPIASHHLQHMTGHVALHVPTASWSWHAVTLMSICGGRRARRPVWSIDRSSDAVSPIRREYVCEGQTAGRHGDASRLQMHACARAVWRVGFPREEGQADH